HLVLLVAVALIAGMLGGAGASWFLLSRLRAVQGQVSLGGVVQAERFEVVGEDGKPRAILGELDKSSFQILMTQRGYAEELKKELEGKSAPFGLFLLVEGKPLATLSLSSLTGDPDLSLFSLGGAISTLHAYEWHLEGSKAGDSIRLSEARLGPHLTLVSSEG